MPRLPFERPAQALQNKGFAAAVPAAADFAQCLELKTGDGSAHFARFWQAPQAGPLVVHLHGIEGHSLWFAETAAALSQAGISTCALDRRGAGRSGGRQGDVASYKRLVADVEELIEQLSQRFAHTSLFLFGNCWGAKVAALAAAQGRLSQLSGLIFTSPAWVTQVDLSLVQKVKVAVNYLLGGSAYFDIPLTPAHFTGNPAYLSYISSDELRLKQATSRFFIENLKLSRACLQALSKLTLPVLVLQSGRDAIVDLKGIERWFACVGSSDKTLKIFTEAAHSLDFEGDQAQYQDCLSNWIASRASAKATAGQP